MPPKTATTATTLARTSGKDTSIEDADLSVVTQGQLQEIVDQLTQNNHTLEIRLNEISLGKTKMPLIKRFIGDLIKLKGFLVQIKFRIYQEGIKLVTAMDKVAFAGIFLVGDLLRWFKPYFADI